MNQEYPKKIDSIQHLRFLAAAMVLFGHAMMEAHKLGIVGTDVYRNVDIFPWGSGVDMFFIISGYIVCHVTKNTGHAFSDVKTFAIRRIIRIYPVYWLYTALMIVAIVFFNAVVTNNKITTEYIVASILLFPWPRPSDELIRPILGQGWTLSYEMFFYFIFGFSLILKKQHRYIAVCLAMALVFIAGNILSEKYWIRTFFSYSIILEFILGILVYNIVSRIRKIEFLGCVVLIILGIIGLLLGEFLAVPDAWRLVSRGLPSSLIVLGWVFLERDRVFPAFFVILKKLGDASYSLYLSHPFVIIPLAIAWKKLSIGYPFIFIILVVFSSIIFSIISFEIFEKRINMYLNKK